MKRIIILAVLAVANAITDGQCTAALVSSSRTFNEQVRTGFHIFSGSINPQGVPIRGESYFNVGNLFTGVASASVTTDTVADTGVVDAMTFAPFSVVPATVNSSFSTSFTIVDVPANFPDPAVTRQVSGVWTERITISGVTGDVPTFVSSSPGALIGRIHSPPVFAMSNNMVVSAPTFTVSGTYQVTGPLSTTDIPFSVEYQPTGQAVTGMNITGGAGFADGFAFSPIETVVVYEAVNPVIFDGVVDGLTYSAGFYDGGVGIVFARGVFIPEPSSLAIAAIALSVFHMHLRRDGRQ